MSRLSVAAAVLALCVAAFLTLLLRHVSYPLLWQDEAETAVFAQRILEYGYPKVHGPKNVVYEFGTNVALGIDERLDAYIGTTWGHFYFAVPGVWWASTTDDLYAKTARIRIPFALAGALGLALFVFAVTPVFPSRSRRLGFAACFFVLAGLSVSLVLHLREARYYSLLVLLGGAITFVYLRHAVFGRGSARACAIGLAALLVALFNVFYSAFFIVGALLGLDGWWRVWRAGPDDRARRLLREWAPLIAAGVCVAPLIVYFETFQIAAEFSRQLGLTPWVYGENLARVASHLARHEWLIAAGLARAGVWLADRRGGLELDPGQRSSRRIASRLIVFAVGYTLIGCLNPLVYERYFVLLSPVLSLSFLLDAASLVEASRARQRVAVFAALSLLVSASLVPRAASIGGRAQELLTPYRGPLDFAIPWIRDRFPDPSQLVIATNYENHPYMYYLGSHVIVGFSLSNIRADRLLEPDVVVPRRRWRSTLPEIRRFLARGRYVGEPLPVRDIHYNNTPSLSASPSTPDPHRFRTPVPETDAQRLEIYTRVGS